MPCESVIVTGPPTNGGGGGNGGGNGGGGGGSDGPNIALLAGVAAVGIGAVVYMSRDDKGN